MENYYIICNEINLYICYEIYEDEYKAYINYIKTNNDSKFIFEIPKKYIKIYSVNNNLYSILYDRKVLISEEIRKIKIDQEKLKLIKILY